MGEESEAGAADRPLPRGSKRRRPVGRAQGRLRTAWMLEFLLRGLDSKVLPRHPVTLTGSLET